MSRAKPELLDLSTNQTALRRIVQLGRCPGLHLELGVQVWNFVNFIPFIFIILVDKEKETNYCADIGIYLKRNMSSGTISTVDYKEILKCVSSWTYGIYVEFI